MISLKKTAVAAAVLAALALPALASTQGAVSSIELRDFDRDGKIDRAVITVQNPSHTAWKVRDAAALKIYMNDTALKLSSVFVSSPAGVDPATIEAVIDADEPLVPRSTSTAGFSVSYAPGAMAIGDGQTELQTISKSGNGATAGLVDGAPPVLVSTVPPTGAFDVNRAADVSMTFSEAIAPASFGFSSDLNPGNWVASWSTDGTTVTLRHTPYNSGLQETMRVTGANDLAGNALVADAYPDPFTFRTATTNTQIQQVDNVFQIVTPDAGASLTTGSPDVVAWYGNQTDVASVRLWYSTDSGSTYASIGTFPVSQKTFVWYPPDMPGMVRLKAEGLSAQGAPIAFSVIDASLVTPSAKTSPRVVIPPTATGLSGASATLSFGLDAPVKTAALACNGQAMNAAVVWMGQRPAIATAQLTGLDGNVSYACSFSLTDLFGQAMTVNVPAFMPTTAAPPPPPPPPPLTLPDGSLIKASGAAVYWYLGGKRYVFPNEAVYFTWFRDFSTVSTISDDQLASVMIGGNVTMHSGTWMVKITSDPKVYAVEPGGGLRPIQTEAQAQALYGALWNKHIKDVDVSLFSDYRIRTQLDTGAFQEGYMAKSSDGKVWFVSGNAVRQEVTANGLDANHYKGIVFLMADETRFDWQRLALGAPITGHDGRLDVVRISSDGSPVIAP